MWDVPCNQWGLCCIVVREQHTLPKLFSGGLVQDSVQTSLVADVTFTGHWHILSTQSMSVTEMDEETDRHITAYNTLCRENSVLQNV